MANRMEYMLDVLVPHYSDPAGLKMSLDSVARQTWRGRLRVVVIDDGSSAEDYREVEACCAEFKEQSGFGLLLLRNETNLGRPRTRNRLLDAVEASYVAWLDTGDIWYSNKLSRQFEHLASMMYQDQNIDTVWVSCCYDWQQDGHVRSVLQHADGDQLREILVGQRLRAYLWTLLGTAQAFRIAGRFDERLPRLQDMDYFVNFVRGGGRIEVPSGQKPLCRYFKSRTGQSASDVRDAYKLILAKNAPALREYPPSLASRLHYKANKLAAMFAMSNGKPGATALYMLRAIFGSPRHSLAMAKVVASKKLSGLLR